MERRICCPNSSFRAHFSYKKKIFRQFKGKGAVALTGLPRATTRYSRWGVCFNLTTRNTGYPFEYPTGTRVQKYPKVRALSVILRYRGHMVFVYFKNNYHYTHNSFSVNRHQKSGNLHCSLQQSGPKEISPNFVWNRHRVVIFSRKPAISLKRSNIGETLHKQFQLASTPMTMDDH